MNNQYYIRPITALCKFDQAPFNFITKKEKKGKKATEAGQSTGAGYAQWIGAIATQLITINGEDWSRAALQASGGMSYYVAAVTQRQLSLLLYRPASDFRFSRHAFFPSGPWKCA